MSKNTAFKEFLTEVEEKFKEAQAPGKNSQKRRKVSPIKTTEVEGEAVVPTPRGGFNSFEAVASFEDWFSMRCAYKKSLDVKIKKLEQRRTKVVRRIFSMVEEQGIDAKTPTGESLVYFAEPYKAQIAYDLEGGDINLEAIRKHFPKMVVTEEVVRKVDFNAMESQLKHVPGLTLMEAEQLKAAIAVIRTIGPKFQNKEIFDVQSNETVTDEFLIQLNEGKIAPEITKEIIGEGFKVLNPKAIRVDKMEITSFGRCGCCGYKKKSSEAKNPNFICPDCG